MSTPPLMTNARRSLWRAIDAWPALKKDGGDPTATVFAQRMEFEDESPLTDNIEPSISELPCIAIVPTLVNPVWYLNQMMNWPLVFQVTVWVQDWTLPQLEKLIEDVTDAIYKATPNDGSGSTVPIVKAAVGFYPQSIGPFSIAPVRIGRDAENDGTKATRVLMTITVRNNKNPLGDG